MKKFALALLSASLLSTMAFADEDKVLATFKGGQVKESQVLTQFKAALDMQPNTKGKKFSELEPNLQEALVKSYVNMQLLLDEAKSQGIESSKEFQEKMNNVKSQMLQQEVIEKFIKSAVTDKMIEEEYNKMAATYKGKEEVKVSHILVDSEEKAKEVKKKLSKGAKFADLAKEYSKDEGTKVNGGELGYVMEGQLVPEFENKAFSMKVNEISDPVKTAFGWHIIKVMEKRPAQVPALDVAKPSLSNKLSREAVEKYFNDLAAKADVKLNLPKIEVNPEPKAEAAPAQKK
jgi:parvulin-like peptidyl-prolyl isomerase